MRSFGRALATSVVLAGGFHHVDEPGGAAESHPQLSLEVRDRGLPGVDDDPGGLVIELVLVEFKAVGPGLVVLSRDRLIEHRLALLAQEARESRALLLGDVRSVESNTP